MKKKRLGGGFSLVLSSRTLIFFIYVFIFNNPRGNYIYDSLGSLSRSNHDDFGRTMATTTTLKHLLASNKMYHFRRDIIESWWRPNQLKGYLYLDIPPQGSLLPWSQKSPPYRLNDNISSILDQVKHKSPVFVRIVHGILELFRQVEHDRDLIRWIIMGDDNTVFFMDNLVEVLSKYDHTKYYYLGNPSEFVLSNYWFSFNQAFGGGGVVLVIIYSRSKSTDLDIYSRKLVASFSSFSS